MSSTSMTLSPFLSHTPGQYSFSCGPTFQYRPRLRPLTQMYPLVQYFMLKQVSAGSLMLMVLRRRTGLSNSSASPSLSNSSSLLSWRGTVNIFQTRGLGLGDRGVSLLMPFQSSFMLRSQLMWPIASTISRTVQGLLDWHSRVMLGRLCRVLSRLSVNLPSTQIQVRSCDSMVQVSLKPTGSSTWQITMPRLYISSSMLSKTRGWSLMALGLVQSILSKRLITLWGRNFSTLAMGMGSGISGTYQLAYFLMASLKTWNLGVAVPCSLMGASQSQEVSWPAKPICYTQRELAPAVSPKLVPPCAMYMEYDRLWDMRNQYCLTL